MKKMLKTYNDVRDLRPWKASPAMELIWLLLRSLKEIEPFVVIQVEIDKKCQKKRRKKNE